MMYGGRWEEDSKKSESRVIPGAIHAWTIFLFSHKDFCTYSIDDNNAPT